MELIQLLKQGIKDPLWKLIGFVVVTGLSNAILVSVISISIETPPEDQSVPRLYTLFIAAAATFLLSRKYILDKATVIIESAISKSRNRITNKIRHVELASLEKIGTSPLNTALTQESTYISTFAISVVSSIQSAIMIIFIILYIGIVSVWSFLMAVIIIGIGLAAYVKLSDSFNDMMRNISKDESAFYKKLEHIIQGFKEIKIDYNKNELVFNDFKKINKQIKKRRIKLGQNFNVIMVFTQTLLYVLIGFLLFILPHYHAEHTGNMIKVVTAVLMIVGPLNALTFNYTFFSHGNNAARNILNLESLLNKELRKNKINISDLKSSSVGEIPEAFPNFESVQLNGLTYAYPPKNESKHIFQVGPVDLTITKGEILFITGGNGSGKSTFLKLLTGLYSAKSGEILIGSEDDEQPPIKVTPENSHLYRNLYTTIFTDFHLFDRLYSVKQIDPEIVNTLLLNMEMPHEKTKFVNGRFSNTDLSSGQRKRLALTASLLEDKPIYIFDEVASDLDPEFRDKFYYELLTELKDRNKMVIVVSHDRHYWTVPDRLVEMDSGSLRVLSKNEIDSLLALNKSGRAGE